MRARTVASAAYATMTLAMSLSWPTFSASDLTSFYPTAWQFTQSPPTVSSLSKVCERHVRKHFVSFWSQKEGGTTLVVFTEKRVKELGKVISLRVRFNPIPTARVDGPQATLDWGYVFDRNDDGKVDYLAFLDGARFIAPEKFPDDYPVGEKSKRLTDSNLKLAIENARLAFIHFADDNFDGVVDGLVAPLPDPEHFAWVSAYGVLKSSRFDETVDQDWAFKERITDAVGSVPRSEGGFLMLRDNPPEIREGSAWLRGGAWWLTYINEAAQRCGLKSQH